MEKKKRKKQGHRKKQKKKSVAPDLDALLAKALEELRTLPPEKVRQVLEAARAALQGAVALAGTVSGSAKLSGELTVTLAGVAATAAGLVGGAEQVESVTATDAYDAEVFSGKELPPASGDLFKGAGRLVRKNAAKLVVGTLLFFMKACSDHLGLPTVIVIGSNNNVSVVQQQAPPPTAAKAPEDSARAEPTRPLPPMKKL